MKRKGGGMKKKLVFYDLDGTLADTRKDIVLAANHMMEAMGQPPLGAREIQRYVGSGLRDLVGRCLKAQDPEVIERGTRIFKERYSKHYLDYTRLYPGVLEILEHFKACRQFVVTNKPNPIATEILEALGIGNYFEAIIAGNSGYPPKPDPTIFLNLMEEGGMTPQETLLIGDSLIDIEAGERAGIPVAVLTQGFSEEHELKTKNPALLFADIQALLAYAREAGW